MVTVYCIYGGQFGSEGKGLLSQFLSEKDLKVSVSTTNSGPNSGHTAIINGKKLITYHLPMFGLLHPSSPLMYLNAGAIINPSILLTEIKTIEDEFSIPVRNRLKIDPFAAIVTPEDIKYEEGGGPSKIASTGKGVGSALSRKIKREAMVAKSVSGLNHFISRIDLNTPKSVMVEVSQGFSLGINQGFYPYTTSRQCTPIQAMSDAGLRPQAPLCFMVVRTRPIRVGNTLKGHSGGCYSDQKEITWEEIGVKPEITTVTSRERRVFTWSKLQVEQAIIHGRPVLILINFAQYSNEEELVKICNEINKFCVKELSYQPKLYLGFGPNMSDIQPVG